MKNPKLNLYLFDVVSEKFPTTTTTSSSSSAPHRREVRVLCWVMTRPDNHKTRVKSDIITETYYDRQRLSIIYLRLCT